MVLIIDVPEEFMGPVMEKLGPRKGEMVNMTSAVNGYSRLEFRIPARGLIGFRNDSVTLKLTFVSSSFINLSLKCLYTANNIIWLKILMTCYYIPSFMMACIQSYSAV